MTDSPARSAPDALPAEEPDPDHAADRPDAGPAETDAPAVRGDDAAEADPAADPEHADAPFAPVPLRARHDGWTPDRQNGFIEALADTGCVDEACRAVGMSSSAAYALRRRIEAQSFRLAWDAALDHAMRRLTDVAIGRAMYGTATPVFYRGEQIGERRRYDERLTMFLLRYRDPSRYGAWIDKMRAERHPDGPAITLGRAINNLADDAWADELGEPRTVRGRKPRSTWRKIHERGIAAEATAAAATEAGEDDAADDFGDDVA